MKRLLSVLLALLLCLGVAALPAAAEEGDTPDPAAPTQEAPAQPEPADPDEPTLPAPETPAEPPAQEQQELPAFSPYEAPDWHNYEDTESYEEAYSAWEQSVCGRYFQWRGNYNEERPRFDPAFRAFYRDDPLLTVTDRFVYKKVQGWEWEGKKRVRHNYAVLLDYFDTDEAAKSCTTLRIPAELGGCRVRFYMQCGSYWSGKNVDSNYSNDTVKKLILEEGIREIGEFAFSDFTALKSVEIPSTVTAIGVGAFRGCTALKKVYGCAGLERLQSSAFAGCEKLYSFANMDHLKGMEGAAFSGCGFRSLTLPVNIGLGGGDEDYYQTEYVFSGCKELKKVTFLSGDKKSWLQINGGAFADCPNLRTVTLPKVCGTIDIGDKAFKNCAALQAVKNTDHLRRLGRFVFEGCKSLKSFTLPAGFEYGAADSFKGCSLRELVILSKNQKLFSGTFEPDVYYWGDTGNGIGKNLLEQLPKKCTIYVVSKDMKYAVKSFGFTGTVKIRVNVPTPKTATKTKKNGTVTLKWSKVTMADGYRIWSYNPKTGKYTKLATVKAPKTGISLKSGAKQFVIRAYRIEAGDVSWSAIKAFK